MEYPKIIENQINKSRRLANSYEYELKKDKNIPFL